MLYWAYGSNLSHEAMRVRCPGAKPVDKLTLNDGVLTFRYIADVVVRKGSTVPGGLWKITKEHEQELDRYEGVKGGLYLKRYLVLKRKGRKAERCLFYQMSESVGIAPPGEHYFRTILQGYKDFDLPVESLYASLEEAWTDKRITTRIKNRVNHNTRGSLMRLSS